MRRKWRRILRLHHLQQGSVGHLPHTVKWTDRTSSLELPSRWPSALWWNEPENRIVVHQFIYYTTAIWISLSSFSRLWDWCARQWLRDHRRTCHWWWRWQRACCEVQHQGRSNFAAQIAGTKIPSRMRILLWSEQCACKFQYYGIIVDIVQGVQQNCSHLVICSFVGFYSYKLQKLGCFWKIQEICYMIGTRILKINLEIAEIIEVKVATFCNLHE